MVNSPISLDAVVLVALGLSVAGLIIWFATKKN